MTTEFKDLPVEIIMSILEYLTPKDVEKLILSAFPLKPIYLKSYHIERLMSLMKCSKVIFQLLATAKRKPSVGIKGEKRGQMSLGPTNWLSIWSHHYQKITECSKSLKVCNTCRYDFEKKICDWLRDDIADRDPFNWTPFCNKLDCVYYKDSGNFGAKVGNAYDYGWF